MKGNKKQQELLELRAAQAKELEIKTKIVAVKEAHIKERYVNELSYRGSEEWWNDELEVKAIKARIDELHIETLEKKYANNIMYTDVNPYEVIEEIDAKTYMIREMKANITEEASKKLKQSFVPGGFVGHFDNSLQEWDITSDETAPIIKIRKHKDGFFYTPKNGRRFRIDDHPVKRYDFNF